MFFWLVGSVLGFLLSALISFDKGGVLLPLLFLLILIPCFRERNLLSSCILLFFACFLAFYRVSFPGGFLDFRGLLSFSLSPSVKNWILFKIETYPHLSPWLKSLFLGMRSSLSYKAQITFSSLGLYHLLVLSGLHIGFLGASFHFLGLFVIKLAYSLRLISPKVFLILACLVHFFVCGLLILYSSLVSFSAPIQRALLSYFLFSLYSLLSVKTTVLQRFSQLLGLQILLFPQDLLSCSGFLSWGCCLILSFIRFPSEKGFFFSFLCSQILLTLLVGILVGKLSLLGLLLNPLIVPLFAFVYSSSLLFLLDFFLPPLIISMVFEFHSVFVYFLERLAVLPQIFPWLYLDVFSYSPYLRGVLLCLFVLFFLCLSRNLKR